MISLYLISSLTLDRIWVKDLSGKYVRERRIKRIDGVRQGIQARKTVNDIMKNVIDGENMVGFL